MCNDSQLAKPPAQQSSARTKGFLSDVLYGIRHTKDCQAVTLCKRLPADAAHTLRYHNLFQRRAAEKGTFPDFRQPERQIKLPQ